LEAITRVTRGVAGDSAGSEDRIPIQVPEGLEELAPAYLEARRHDLTKATALLARDDFDGLSTIGHNMAGSGSSYGFAC
jgi:hypothetical protein